MKPTTHRLLVPSLLLIFLLLLSPSVGMAQSSDPAIKLDPGSGTPGTAVTVSAFYFSPNQTLGIYWDTETNYLGDIVIEKAGTGSQLFAVPSDAAVGTHTVFVDDKPTGKRAKAEFVVEPKITDTPIPKPTYTPTVSPTKFPGYPNTPTFTPTSTATRPWVPPLIITTIPPPWRPITQFDPRCTDLGLGTGTVVLNFDDLSSGVGLDSQYNTLGVNFVSGMSLVDTPPMGARSPSLAARSLSTDIPAPVAIRFRDLVRAVGVFVGRGSPSASGAVYAVLKGYSPSIYGDPMMTASARVRLPTSANSFERCLVIQSDQGRYFSYVTLDYVNSAGRSVGDTRWFDDFTFIPSTLRQSDNPPNVMIISPMDGSRVNSNSVGLTARIFEDVRLSSVSMSVNGGPLTPIGWRAAGGSDLTRYDANAYLANLNPDAQNTVRVVATDSAGQTGETTSSFFYPLTTGDIWVTGIEVSQSIQTTTNSIPLLGNKTTIVRVYVQSREDSRGPWNDVSAELVVRNGSTSTTYTPANSTARTGYAGSQTYKIITVLPTGSSRTDLVTGFYFLLNRADTATGTRDLEARIFSVSRRPEVDYDNNRQTLSVGFSNPISLTIYGVPFAGQPSTAGQYYDNGAWVCDIPQPHPFSNFEAHRIVVENMLPVSTFTILPYPGLASRSGTLPCVTSPPAQPPPHFASLFAARAWAEGLLPGYPAGTIIYLLEPKDTCGCGECMRVGSSFRINGQDNRTPDGFGRVMAHELGHALGMWWHIVSPPAHTAYAPWNSAYPHVNASIGPQVGVNLSNPNAVELMYYSGSHDMHALMSYSWPQWISPYEYCTVLSHFNPHFPCDSATFSAQAPIHSYTKVAASQVRQSSGEKPVLYLAGWINADGTQAGIDSLETILAVQDPPAPNQDGFFWLVLEDQGGEVLGYYPFDITHTDGPPEEQHRFSMIVPYDSAISRVALYQDEILLAERLTGGYPPSVSVSSPNGGEELSGLQTIAWSGKSANPLYSVQYSADNGQTWLPLGVGLTVNSLEVDFNNLPGSDQALIRVVASDGIQYAVDQSNAAFKVPAKAPQVTIVAPLEGDSFTGGVPIIAEVTGFDWEDTTLPDEAYAWSSDRDGSLGDGRWIMIPSLSEGEHALTVTATDSAGNSTSASIHVSIVPPVVEQITVLEQPAGETPVVEPPAGEIPAEETSLPAVPWTIYALGGAVLVIIALVVILVASRRRKPG